MKREQLREFVAEKAADGWELWDIVSMAQEEFPELAAEWLEAVEAVEEILQEQGIEA